MPSGMVAVAPAYRHRQVLFEIYVVVEQGIFHQPRFTTLATLLHKSIPAELARIQEENLSERNPGKNYYSRWHH